MRDAVDACLTKAFRDVAVPEGLAERLLAGLAVDGGADISVGGADIPVCRKGHSAFGRQECLPHRSRRWLFLAGGLAAAAATILLAVWLGGQGNPSISQQDALDEAIKSFDAGFKQPGVSLAKQSAPRNVLSVSRCCLFAEPVGTGRTSSGVAAWFTTCRAMPPCLWSPATASKGSARHQTRRSTPSRPPLAIAAHRLGKRAGCSMFWWSEATRQPTGVI